LQNKNISIEIDDAGLKLIRIIDNGSGMAYDDLPLAIERFATSKAVNLDDVYSATTFGFRGEALAAISSVSDFSLKSGMDSNNIFELRSKYGDPHDIKPASGLQGTTITINNLFENFPARRRFLKSAKSLENEIVKFIKSFALINHNLDLNLIVNSNKTYSIKKDDTVLNKISKLYQDKIFISSNYKRNNVDITVTTTDIVSSNRARRDAIIIGVNGRLISDRALIQAVSQAYFRLIPDNNFPIAVIDIRIDPTNVDANVHPSKLEVRFHDSTRIYSAVVDAVKDTLAQTNAFNSSKQQIDPIQQANSTNFSYITNTNSSRNFDKTTNNTSPSTSINYISESSSSYEQIYSTDNLSNYDVNLNLNRQVNNKPNIPIVDIPLFDVNNSDNFKIIGQLFNTFILIEKDDELIYIDQHIAHERILYEKNLKKSQTNRKSIVLHAPVTIKFDEDIIIAISENKDIISSLGYLVNIKSTDTIEVLEIPFSATRLDIEIAFKSAVEEIFERGVSGSSDSHIISKSCKRSIKAGDRLTMEEMQYLVTEILNSDNNSTCPHGRPITFKMSLTELSRKFGR